MKQHVPSARTFFLLRSKAGASSASWHFTGGGNDERPVVQLPMEFAGSIYDVMFGLNDRDDFTTECLLNRYVMSEFLNVMVNPARKYVISTKYTLDK